MAIRLDNVFRLGVKELYSLSVDPILLVMIVYALSFAVYAQATGAKFEVEHVGVGIVDEDRSELSRRSTALQQPLFKPPVEISADEIDPAMNSGRFVFVVEVPRNSSTTLWLAGNRRHKSISTRPRLPRQASVSGIFRTSSSRRL